MSDKQKIYAFIDSQNLNLGIKSLGGKLDFQKFLKFIKNKYRIQKAFLFIGYIKENQQLYDHLKDCGYILIFKQTLIYKEKYKFKTKGNVDAELVLHSSAREFKFYDKAIFVSGDGDFACLYEFLEEKNKLLKILIPNKYSFSSLLRKYTDFFEFISNNRLKLEKKKLA